MGLFETENAFDYHTFKYKITRLPVGLEVRFSHSLWQSAKPFLWTAILAVPGILLLHWFGTNPWSVLFASPFLGCAALFLMIAAFSLRRTTMWLFPSEIKVQKGILGLGNIRTYPVTEVVDFGIGLFGHSKIPVLKFEVGKEWITLVRANELEASDFLLDIEAHGWKIPR
jgi:hypothetical protein